MNRDAHEPAGVRPDRGFSVTARCSGFAQLLSVVAKKLVAKFRTSPFPPRGLHQAPHYPRRRLAMKRHEIDIAHLFHHRINREEHHVTLVAANTVRGLVSKQY
jgi:hypothetical protein